MKNPSLTTIGAVCATVCLLVLRSLLADYHRETRKGR